MSDLPESSEAIAKRISDAGTGLSPVSKIREAVYDVALKEIRAVRSGSQFYEGMEGQDA